MKRLIAAIKVLTGQYGVTRWAKRNRFQFMYPGEDSWCSFGEKLNIPNEETKAALEDTQGIRKFRTTEELFEDLDI